MINRWLFYPLWIIFCSKHWIILVFTCVLSRLLCMGGEKRAWYTLFVHAPRISGNFGSVCKICSITLTSVRHANFTRVKEPAIDHVLCGRWQRRDEANKLFTYGNYPCIYLFQLNAMFTAHHWCNPSLWSSLIYHQSDIYSDFKATRMCFTGCMNITWCSRLPRELSTFANSVYQALFPPPTILLHGCRNALGTNIHGVLMFAWVLLSRKGQ